jgi:hypothetical protein
VILQPNKKLKKVAQRLSLAKNKKARLGGLFYLLLIFRIRDNLGRFTEEDGKEE